MNKNVDKTKSKVILSISLVLCLVIAVVLGATYAYFSTRTGKDNNTLVTTGTLQIEYGDGVEIQASNLKPATRGQVLDAYNQGNCIYGEDNTDNITTETICYAKTFTIRNTGTLTAYANTTLLDIENTYSENLLYEVFETAPNALTGASLGTNTNLVGLPTNALIPVGSTGKSYTILIWLSELAGNVDQNQTYKAKLVTKATQTNADNVELAFYQDASKANAPELADGMIPLVYSETTGNWVKADYYNIESAYAGYDYENKKWANAALVKSVSETNTKLSNGKTCTGENNYCTREDYMNAGTGIVIPEADILGYFVWIPRYKYQLFNVEFASVEEQEIVVEFEKGTESTGTVTCEIDASTKKEVCTDIVNGTVTNHVSTYTHPAFTFGEDELTGLWIAKFETSGTAEKPLSKPYQTTLVSQNVATQFTTGQQFGTAEYLTIIGVSEVDAHMAKNIEWGAIAYLKQSKYGQGLTEIMLNNYNQVVYNSNNSANTGIGYFTGCGSTTTSATTTKCTDTTNGYQTVNGQASSTNGNITGIYDTRGGAHDRVMGVMYASGNTTILYQSSGFSASNLTPDSKYVDMYAHGTSNSDYTRSHLGDATGETRDWYSDNAYFAYYTTSATSTSWFGRGGIPREGVNAGSFAFSVNSGNSFAVNSFRTVITINN